MKSTIPLERQDTTVGQEHIKQAVCLWNPGTRFYSLLPLMRFFGESGYVFLMGFENDAPMLLSCGQVSLEPPYELVVRPLRRFALCICCLGRHSKALGGPIFEPLA